MRSLAGIAALAPALVFIHSTASLTKTIQIRLSAVSIMVGVALPIIDKFDNVYILWVNNASTSFFTLFHSLNFIFTAYFA